MQEGLQHMEEDLEALRLSRRLRLCKKEDEEARIALELWMGQLGHLAVSDALQGLPEVMWSLSEAETVAAREGPIHALEALREVAFAQHPPLKEVVVRLRDLGAQLQAEGLWALGAELVVGSELLEAARGCRKLGHRMVAGLTEAHTALGPVVQTLLEETQMELAARTLGLRCTLWQHEVDLGRAAQEASQLGNCVRGLNLEAATSLEESFAAVDSGLEQAREADIELRDTQEAILRRSVEQARARKVAQASVDKVHTPHEAAEASPLELNIEPPPVVAYEAPDNKSALGFISRLETQAGLMESEL